MPLLLTRRAALAPVRRTAARFSDPKASEGALSTIDSDGPNYRNLDRNLALELVRVTEAAALAAARHLGRGDKNAADGAAVDAMRGVLNAVSMRGVVVLGEGEKDAAPMLFNGEEVGDGTGPRCDVSVDPIDGTTLVSKGRDGAIAVIAVAAEGAMLACGGSNAPFYQNKLIVGPQINPHHVSLRWPVARNVRAIATALNKPVEDVTVCILDRPRHEQLIGEVRDCGARIKLISDGDIAAAIEAADPTSPVDVVMGIGGSPEGVIAAAALACMGGSIQAQFAPRDDAEREAAIKAGFAVDQIMFGEDLCDPSQVFVALTAISDGLLPGVRPTPGGAVTSSLVMRSASGTVRRLTTQHRWSRPGVTNPPA